MKIVRKLGLIAFLQLIFIDLVQGGGAIEKNNEPFSIFQNVNLVLLSIGILALCCSFYFVIKMFNKINNTPDNKEYGRGDLHISRHSNK